MKTKTPAQTLTKNARVMTTSSPFCATWHARVAALLVATLALVGAARADTAREINASADAAVADFRSTIKGADDYLAAAKGVLVVPHVKKSA